MTSSRLKSLLKKSRPVSRSGQRRTLTLEALEDRTVLSFLPAVTFPVGVHPRAIAVGDLNNDAAPDIAVVNMGQFSNFQSSLSVLLGNGDGSFRPAVTTDLLNTGVALSVALGDFNGDGLTDVVVATGGSTTHPAVEVLLGKGDGSFREDHRVLSVGQNPFSVAVGDFDGNGAFDLVTANSGSGTLSVLLGNGDASFRPRIDLAVGAAPRAVAVEDFNGDGLLDLVTAQQISDTVSVLLGRGNGTFAPPMVFAASGDDFTPSSLAVGDVNGDGRADLVINSHSELESPASQIGVLLGNGNGTFQAPILHFPDGPDGDVALGDFNNDGLTDAAVVGLTFGVPPGGLRVFRGNGDGTFQRFLIEAHSTGGNEPLGVAAGDLNGDGLVDLVATNTFFSTVGSSTVGVLLNSSTVAAPRVASVAVNGGAAQRSRVTDLTVTFSTQVAFAASPGGAFALRRTSDGAAVGLSASASVVGGATVVTLTGFTGAATQSGSLADGDYTLTTLANQVSAAGIALDGNGDGAGGDNNAQGLFRFFGDSNGDRRVDIADFGLLSTTFSLRSGQPGFIAAFDFNGDGRIDIADFGQFSVRFFTVLP